MVPVSGQSISPFFHSPSTKSSVHFLGQIKSKHLKNAFPFLLLDNLLIGPILKDFATSHSQKIFTVSATLQNLSEWGLLKIFG